MYYEQSRREIVDCGAIVVLSEIPKRRKRRTCSVPRHPQQGENKLGDMRCRPSRMAEADAEHTKAGRAIEVGGASLEVVGQKRGSKNHAASHAH